MTNELEGIRKKKLEQLKKQASTEQNQEEQIKQQIAQLESLVKTILTKEAIQRLGNLKIAHQDKYIQTLAVIAQLMQTQGVNQINDEQLKKILIELTPQKKEFKIKRV